MEDDSELCEVNQLVTTIAVAVLDVVTLFKKLTHPLVPSV